MPHNSVFVDRHVIVDSKSKNKKLLINHSVNIIFDKSFRGNIKLENNSKTLRPVIILPFNTLARYFHKKNGKYNIINNRYNIELPSNGFLIYFYGQDVRYLKIQNNELTVDTDIPLAVLFDQNIINKFAKGYDSYLKIGTTLDAIQLLHNKKLDTDFTTLNGIFRKTFSFRGLESLNTILRTDKTHLVPSGIDFPNKSSLNYTHPNKVSIELNETGLTNLVKTSHEVIRLIKMNEKENKKKFEDEKRKQFAAEANKKARLEKDRLAKEEQKRILAEKKKRAEQERLARQKAEAARLEKEKQQEAAERKRIAAEKKKLEEEKQKNAQLINHKPEEEKKKKVKPKLEIEYDQKNKKIYGTPENDEITLSSNYREVWAGKGKDKITGSEFDDKINGGEGNDIIFGSLGSDHINGGAGENTISYKSFPTGIEANIMNYSSDVTKKFQDITHKDSIKNIHHIIGTEFDDNINNNVGNIWGLGGNDKLTGRDKDQSIYGGQGDDTLDGKGGADILDGGEGQDTVTYKYCEGGVEVNLMTGNGKNNNAQGDKLINIENVTGTDHKDILIGDDKANILNGIEGQDQLIGNGGNDTLISQYGGAIMIGGPGADKFIVNYTFYERGGYVSYEKSTGVDVDLNLNTAKGGDAEGDTFQDIRNIKGSSLGDKITGDYASNKLWGEAGNDTLHGGSGHDHLWGGAGRDELHGDDGKDYLYGGEGDDTLNGGDGDDHLYGGNGEDILKGGYGMDTFYPDDDDCNDTFDGGPGIDIIDCSSLDRSVYAYLYDDETGTLYNRGYEKNIVKSIEKIIGTSFDDKLDGNKHSNEFWGGDGKDTILGYEGEDKLYGGPGADDLSGGAHNDKLYGGSGDDELDGGAGNDFLEGGIGADFLQGGEGKDKVNYSKSKEAIQIDLEKKIAKGGDAEGDTYESIEIITGSNFDDLLIGDEDDNQLQGGEGADKIKGSAGKDLLEGGAGKDILDGGDDDDVLIGGLGSDTLIGGKGKDTVQYEASENEKGFIIDLEKGIAKSKSFKDQDSLKEIENVIGSDGEDTIIGNDEKNILNGRRGKDHIKGHGGKDIIDGGWGNDILDGGEGRDILKGNDENDTLIGGPGNDILDGEAHRDTVEYLTSPKKVKVSLRKGIAYDGFGTKDRLISIENITGSPFNDILEGDKYNNIINGDKGDDALIGGADDDTLYGGKGSDTLDGGPGEDLLDGGEGKDVITYKKSLKGVKVNLAEGKGYKGDAEGDKFKDIEGVIGSRHNDVIIGSSDDNIILTGEGSDVIFGRGGDNTYILEFSSEDVPETKVVNLSDGFNNLVLKSSNPKKNQVNTVLVTGEYYDQEITIGDKKYETELGFNAFDIDGQKYHIYDFSKLAVFTSLDNISFQYDFLKAENSSSQYFNFHKAEGVIRFLPASKKANTIDISNVPRRGMYGDHNNNINLREGYLSSDHHYETGFFIPVGSKVNNFTCNDIYRNRVITNHHDNIINGSKNINLVYVSDYGLEYKKSDNSHIVKNGWGHDIYYRAKANSRDIYQKTITDIFVFDIAQMTKDSFKFVKKGNSLVVQQDNKNKLSTFTITEFNPEKAIFIIKVRDPKNYEDITNQYSDQIELAKKRIKGSEYYKTPNGLIYTNLKGGNKFFQSVIKSEALRAKGKLGLPPEHEAKYLALAF